MTPKTTLRLNELLEGLIGLKSCYIHGYDLLQKNYSDQNQISKGKRCMGQIQEKLRKPSMCPLSVVSDNDVLHSSINNL